MPAGPAPRPAARALGHVAEEGRVDQPHLRRTPAARRRPAPSGGGRATGRSSAPPPAARATATVRSKAAGSFTSRLTARGRCPPRRRGSEGGDVGGQVRPVELGDRALPEPWRTTPSWSSTASPSRVSHTSLSRPVAPSRTASRKASSVFSGAWARAPRWANPIGGRRSDGSRVGTTAHCGRGPSSVMVHLRPTSDSERTSQGRAGRAGRHGNGDQGELPRLRRRRARGQRPRGAGLHPGRAGHLRLPLPELPDVGREAGRAPDRRHAGGLGVAAGRVAPARRALRAPRRRPITHDDLIDFHRLLQDDDWFDSVLSARRDRPALGDPAGRRDRRRGVALVQLRGIEEAAADLQVEFVRFSDVRWPWPRCGPPPIAPPACGHGLDRGLSRGAPPYTRTMFNVGGGELIVIMLIALDRAGPAAPPTRPARSARRWATSAGCRPASRTRSAARSTRRQTAPWPPGATSWLASAHRRGAVADGRRRRPRSSERRPSRRSPPPRVPPPTKAAGRSAGTAREGRPRHTSSAAGAPDRAPHRGRVDDRRRPHVAHGAPHGAPRPDHQGRRRARGRDGRRRSSSTTRSSTS